MKNIKSSKLIGALFHCCHSNGKGDKLFHWHNFDQYGPHKHSHSHTLELHNNILLDDDLNLIKQLKITKSLSN